MEGFSSVGTPARVDVEAAIGAARVARVEAKAEAARLRTEAARAQSEAAKVARAEARAEAARLALEGKRRELEGDDDAPEDLDPRHLLIGLTMPPDPGESQVRGELREDWVAFVRALWARGCSVDEFRQLTGWTRSRAYNLWADARAEVAKEIDPGDVLEARREVDAQAQAIGRLAWRYAQAPKLSPRDRAALLKVALDAGKARADALGMSKLTVELAGSAKVEIDIMAEVRQRFGLDADALEAVGAALAQEMSAAARATTRRLRAPVVEVSSLLTADPAPVPVGALPGEYKEE